MDQLLSKPLYIGVDGGGTKTHLAVADINGKLVDFTSTGCTNWESPAYSFENWLKLLQPLADKKVEVAVFTVSGWDFEEGKLQTRTNIEKALEANHVEVSQVIYRNDVFSLYYSGIKNDTSGIALSSGTGCVGVAVDGEEYFQTTAYGYISGEWGSGRDIAEYALHLVCSSLLGREEHYPVLINEAFSYFNAHNLESLVKRLVNPDHVDYDPGFFLANVYNAYQEGCPGARIALEKAGLELAKTSWCLLKKLKKQTVPVIIGGGVIKTIGLSPGFLDKLFELSGIHHEIRVVKSDPVYGSLHQALELGRKPVENINEKINVEIIHKL